MKYSHSVLNDLKHSSKQGFTLIEMLVVMLVIALIAGLSLSRMGNNADRAASEEIKRLQRVIYEVKEFTLYTGSVIAIDFQENQYQFALLDVNDGKWNVAKAEQVHKGFGEHRISKEIAMSFLVEGDDIQNDKTDAAILSDFNADISFSPLGDYQAFHVSFIGDSKEYQLHMNDFGELQVITCSQAC